MVMRPTTSTSSSWSLGGAELVRIPPCAAEDAANVYFVKLEPGDVELAGIPPCAAEEGETELSRTTPDFFFIKPVPWRTETELARTTPVVFFIKLATWRTKAWRLATMLPPCPVG